MLWWVAEINEFCVLVNITPGRSPDGEFLVSRRETMKLPQLASTSPCKTPTERPQLLCWYKARPAWIETGNISLLDLSCATVCNSLKWVLPAIMYVHTSVYIVTHHYNIHLGVCFYQKYRRRHGILWARLDFSILVNCWVLPNHHDCHADNKNQLD